VNTTTSPRPSGVREPPVSGLDPPLALTAVRSSVARVDRPGKGRDGLVGVHSPGGSNPPQGGNQAGRWSQLLRSWSEDLDNSQVRIMGDGCSRQSHSGINVPRVGETAGARYSLNPCESLRGRESDTHPHSFLDSGRRDTPGRAGPSQQDPPCVRVSPTPTPYLSDKSVFRRARGHRPRAPFGVARARMQPTRIRVLS
jgi:hypothetical protein